MAAYLTAPVDRLRGVDPARLDSDRISRWIRATELTWSPGMADHRLRPWEGLFATTDAQLVDTVLMLAGAELDAQPHDSPITLLARRRLPITTLELYTRRRLTDPRTDGACADMHVHQGAALPIEVTLHWVASQLTSIAEDGRSREGRSTAIGIASSRMLEDVDGQLFHPLPLLLALRAIAEDHPNWRLALALAHAAVQSDANPDLWQQMTRLLGYRSASARTPSLSSLRDLKQDAATWPADRRVAMYRIEAILHSAVTQRSPGLDVFVRLFENLASVRRGLLDKRDYYACAIREHVAQTENLKALELRLGERVLADGTPKPSKLGSEYLDALRGYQSVLGDAGQQDGPVRVTFPMGLVKTRGGRLPPQQWRFDPGGIYEIVEALIELLVRCPALVPFVDGLDVCGEERDLPNWLFRPAYERFANATARQARPMACRFHAGEWQWTPVHGLRRIAEFLRFELPLGTPRRVGHALALASEDWSRLLDEPIDELLDDLVWAHATLRSAGAPLELLRALQRAACDALAVAYPSLSAAGVGVAELSEAQAAREDVVTLRRIGFLSLHSGRLTFEDKTPVASSDHPVDRVVVEQLRAGPEPPKLRDVTGRIGVYGGHDPVEQLRLILADAYALLVAEVMRDIRWGSVIVEACPTSNVMVGGVRGYARHPLASLVSAGTLVALGTDDPSLFHAWLGDEINHTRSAMGVSPRDLVRSQRRAVDEIAPLLDVRSIASAIAKAIEQLRSYGVAAA